MKKIIIAALLSTFIAAPAVASDFYAGIKLGTVNYGYDSITNNDQTGFGMLGGYIFNDNFAMEIEFMDLGGFDTPSGVYSGNVLSLNAVSTYPLTEAFSLSGKFGIANTTLDATPQQGFTLGRKTSFSKNALTAGLRGQYNLTSTVGIYAAMDSYAVDATYSGGSDSTTSVATVSSVGGMFKF